MRRVSMKWGTLLLAGALLSACGGATGRHMTVKGSVGQFTQSKRLAIISFAGNTIIAGGGGLGSLVSGALASKSSTGKLTLDQGFVDNSYDLFAGAFQSAGYEVIPVAEVLASPAYQQAQILEMPTYLDAKGLKSVNTKNAEALSKIATELKADRLVYVGSGYGLFGKVTALGLIPTMGKNAGQATADIYVFDPSGKRTLWLNASEVSDTTAATAGGGFQDPSKVMPMFDQAARKLAETLSAKIAKK